VNISRLQSNSRLADESRNQSAADSLPKCTKSCARSKKFLGAAITNLFLLGHCPRPLWKRMEETKGNGRNWKAGYRGGKERIGGRQQREGCKVSTEG